MEFFSSMKLRNVYVDWKMLPDPPKKSALSSNCVTFQFLVNVSLKKLVGLFDVSFSFPPKQKHVLVYALLIVIIESNTCIIN